MAFVVDVGLLPAALQVLAEVYRDDGRIAPARKNDAGEWILAWTDPRKVTSPDDTDVWAGWMRVDFPEGKKRGVRRWA